MLTLDTKFKIPPTVAIPRSLVRHMAGPGYGAKLALQSLHKIKTQQFIDNRLGVEGASEDFLGVSSPVSRGVAKLGFSWAASHVRMWNENGQYKLEDALRDLSDTIKINGHFVGQTHVMDHILVQEFVPHSLELRLFYIEGELVGHVWKKFDKVIEDVPGCFLALEEPAAAAYMRGDLLALDEAVAQAHKIGERWLVWLSALGAEPEIPVMTFDFLVQYKPFDVNPGDAEFDRLVNGVSVAYDPKWDTTPLSDSYRRKGPADCNWSHEPPKYNISRLDTRNNTEPMGAVDVWTLELVEPGSSTFGRNHILNAYMMALARAALKHG